MPRTTTQRIAAKNATAAIKTYYKPKRTKFLRIPSPSPTPSLSSSSLSPSLTPITLSSDTWNYSDWVSSDSSWYPNSPITSEEVRQTLYFSGQMPEDFDYNSLDSLLDTSSISDNYNNSSSSLTKTKVLHSSSTNSELSTFSYRSKTCRTLFDRHSPLL
jgi:hypothetical protein